MDYDLIGIAAIYGAVASLAMTSLGLGLTGRLGGTLVLLIVLSALGLSGWMLVDWMHVTGASLTAMLPRLGTIAGGSIAGAVVGAILPLILNAIGEAMRGDEI